LQFIADRLEIEEGDHVIEVGPGLGFLTRYLAAAGPASITAVDLDHECVRDLDKLAFKNTSIIHGDFLGFDIGSVADTVKIAGNVPYQITTPIVARIFGEIGQPQAWLPKIDRVVLTVQYEVAQRFVAEAGTEHYSQISLLVKYFANCRLLCKVPPQSFYPAPEVTSAIVEFIPLKEPPVTVRNAKMLRQVIKAGFSHRRKMLKNNLSFLQADAESLTNALSQARINQQARAEMLSLEQFAALADAVMDIDRRPGEHV
jgi:16S rRNA (adenine1518-N6/adenine1519-N6)-dimethyltransferase